MEPARIWRSAILLCVVLGVACAQTSSSQISGIVTDATGAFVPNAEVILINETTGVTRRHTTTVAGFFAFPSIPAGVYTLKVEAAGFKAYVRKNSIVQVSTPLSMSIPMDVGPVGETVEVRGSADEVQTSNAVLGNVVSQKAIADLPLNGRNPLNLLMYEPGVVQRSGNTVNVNGARAMAVNVTIDGIEANESSNPNPLNNVFRLNPDNVQEFKVTTSNPSPEDGRNSGANVSIATRSGGNQFHGTVFEFFRATALNANEFYSNALGDSKPRIQSNQYGFELSGPIRRSRTFLFGSWQGQRVNLADPIDKTFGAVNLYTPTALSGVYRYFVVDPFIPFTIGGQRITQNTPLLVEQRTGQLAAGVRNCGSPTDTNCVGSYNIFANDPAGRGMDAAVQAVLSGYPAPNSYSAGDGLNTGSYQWNSPVRIRGPQYMARLDHVISARHSMWGRWLGSEQNTLGGDPFNARPQVLPGYAPRGEVFRPAHNVAVGLRSGLGARVMNELTVGYARFTFLFTQGEANPLFPNTPRFTLNNSAVDYTANPRTFRAVNTPQIVETLSYVTGAHLIRAGVNLRFYQHNDQRGDIGGPSLVPAISLSRVNRPPAGFALPSITSGNFPGIAVQDLNRLQGAINDLLGIPASLTQVFLGDLSSDTFLPFRSGNNRVTLWAQGQRTQQYNLFVQDEWKFRRHLTISYGARWEVNSPPSEAGNRVYVPDRAIDGQGPVSFVKADRWYRNWNVGALAPRLGVTWSPRGRSNIVVRAGYGMAFDPIATFQATSVASAVPGQTYTCTSSIGTNGAVTTTPGCTAVTDVRLADGFANDVPPPSARPSTFLTPPAQLLGNAPAARVFDPNLKLPTVHMWNLTVQREFWRGYVVSLGYVGRRGQRLYRTWDANQIDAAPILPSFLAMQRNVAIAGCRPDGTTSGGTACAGAQSVPLIQQGIMSSAFANSATTVADLSQNAAGNLAGRLEQTTLAANLRPNQQFSQILYFDNGGDSVYHAAQASFRKRFDEHGLMVNGAYTFGKSIDNLSLDPVASTVGGGLTAIAARTPADARNYDNERARSDFDQRHVLNVSGIYEVPFAKAGKLRPVFGNWSLNGIFTWQSGEPFSVRSGVFTANFSAQSRAALKPGVLLPEAKLQDKAGVVGPVFFPNADAFTFPAPGQLGLGRNIFQGPAYWNLDAGISKGFQLTELIKLVFRAEVFNAFNHANFRNPRDASVGTPAITSSVFGQACCATLSTASSASTNQSGESWRVVQLALKLSF